MANKIYTIGREFGSGGREVGEKLAAKLGIKLYDKELLQQAAKDSGFCEEIFENHDEKPTNSFLYSLVMDTYSVSGYSAAPFLDMPLNHKVFLAQFETIKKIAEKESCVIVGRDGQQYLILSLKSAMVRYASERYVEIELLLSEETGLKIPNSAITEKEFYTVPISFFLKGGDSSDEGILVERTDKDGKSTTEFVTPTIYYETDDTYYIDSEYVSSGDILQKPDSSETYRVGADTASLQGVYNINKGYAVFKQIDVLYQNEEYTIVKTGTTYGIALYDHIALDGTKIDENQLIK